MVLLVSVFRGLLVCVSVLVVLCTVVSVLKVFCYYVSFIYCVSGLCHCFDGVV